MLFNVCFFYQKSVPFEALTKNDPKLDKNKSIVSKFSVFVVHKSAVSTAQKSNYVGCFNFRQSMFVFAHLLPDISIKSTKLHFQSWKKILSDNFALFCTMTAAQLKIRGPGSIVWGLGFWLGKDNLGFLKNMIWTIVRG